VAVEDGRAMRICDLPECTVESSFTRVYVSVRSESDNRDLTFCGMFHAESWLRQEMEKR
jgi:hypothetical protein